MGYDGGMGQHGATHNQKCSCRNSYISQTCWRGDTAESVSCRKSYCFRRQLPQESDLLRLSVNSSDWSLQRRHLVPSPVPTDVPTINLAFNTRPYTYVYTNYGINSDAPQSLVKVRRDAVAGQSKTRRSRWSR